MAEPLHYHADARALQELVNSRRQADHIAQAHVRHAFTEADRTFTARQRMVFPATACS